MKVCTDACIFGAWVAEMIASSQLQVTSCLDIGAGTGLLSLILAQKIIARNQLQVTRIDAMEIEDNAFEQLENNCKISPWNQLLWPIHGDAKNFIYNKKYDLIISNPPFYYNDLLSSNQTKNIAKHSLSFKLDDLILIIKNQLLKKGNFAVLLPYHRLEYFENLANKNQFFLKEKFLIKSTSQHEYFRGTLLFSKEENNFPLIKELIIKNQNGNYTTDFIELMKDYYLTL